MLKIQLVLIMENPVAFKLPEYNHSPPNKPKKNEKSDSDTISKTKYYRTVVILSILIVAGTVGGMYLGRSNLLPPGMFNHSTFFTPTIYLSYNLNITIQNSPLEIAVNLTNILSSSLIESSAYCLSNICDWQNFQLSGNTAGSFTIPNNFYYALLNKQNNTIQVMLENKDNMTVIHSVNFTTSLSME
jgi:hypothetical protein